MLRSTPPRCLANDSFPLTTKSSIGYVSYSSTDPPRLPPELSNPEDARQLAADVGMRGHAAGSEALWAGGGVQDELFRADSGRSRRRIGRRAQGGALGFWARARTLPGGAACGVIAELGLVGAGQVTMATLRTDAADTDGRHPAGATFSGSPAKTRNAATSRSTVCFSVRPPAR